MVMVPFDGGYDGTFIMVSMVMVPGDYGEVLMMVLMVIIMQCS